MKTYHMWSPGEEKLETLPSGCEYWDTVLKVWKLNLIPPVFWKKDRYRWPAEPQEQRPTAFGLLSEEEREELKKAYDLGSEIEWYAFRSFDGSVEWSVCHRPGWFDSCLYRIKPQTPQERYNFKITVNGEEIDPKSMSESSWMNLRGEG
jgi:hypothetical protein